MAFDVTRVLETLSPAIVQGPMSGGPSTVSLARAVCEAGGLGVLAAGYRSPEELASEIAEMSRATDRPFGVNLFAAAAGGHRDVAALAAYAERLRPEAEALGVELGTPRDDDDGFDAKLEVVLSARPAVVSFTFGCPDRAVFDRVRRAGIEAWVTVTEPSEAVHAVEQGAAALVVSGVEAGGHRATFTDADGEGELGLLPLLALVRSRVGVPVVAAGGLATPESVAAALAAGAAAAQCGSAFLDTPEAGTHPVHRAALRAGGRTALTRAFTGRRARGIVNRLMTEYGREAPSAYPHVHHLTSPLRAAARRAGRSDLVNLWASEAYELIDHEVPAAQVVARLGGR